MLNSREIKEYLATQFDLVGICPAVSPRGLSSFHQWLDAGYAGDMDYLPDRRDAYSHPRYVMDGVRSVIMLGSKYASWTQAPSRNGGQQADRTNTNSAKGGRIARYAGNDRDYHDLIHSKLKAAKKHLSDLEPDAKFRGVVDTAPLLERDFAQLAGLGWQGKNTLLISKTEGSWIFLSALLTDLELQTDLPFESNHCGSCTACLDACPTSAFIQPYVLDATKCISYWNIESKKLPDDDIREGIGDWLFGCDVCQEVCPWNRKKQAYVEDSSELVGTQTTISADELVKLIEISEEEFRQRFRKTPMWRSRRRGMVRNALLVMGNSRNAGYLQPIERRLKDSEELIRATAAWALGQIGGSKAILALQKAVVAEKSPSVSDEIRRAIANLGKA